MLQSIASYSRYFADKLRINYFIEKRTPPIISTSKDELISTASTNFDIGIRIIESTNFTAEEAPGPALFIGLGLGVGGGFLLLVLTGLATFIIKRSKTREKIEENPYNGEAAEYVESSLEISGSTGTTQQVSCTDILTRDCQKSFFHLFTKITFSPRAWPVR